MIPAHCSPSPTITEPSGVICQGSLRSVCPWLSSQSCRPPPYPPTTTFKAWSIMRRRGVAVALLWDIKQPQIIGPMVYMVKVDRDCVLVKAESIEQATSRLARGSGTTMYPLPMATPPSRLVLPLVFSSLLELSQGQAPKCARRCACCLGKQQLPTLKSVLTPCLSLQVHVVPPFRRPMANGHATTSCVRGVIRTSASAAEI